MAPHYPEWQDKEPYKSVLAGDLNGILSGGYHALIEIVTTTHSGMTTDEFAQWWSSGWRRRAIPKPTGCSPIWCFSRCWRCSGYLRANGFKTFIVSSAPASARWRVERSVLRGWTSADCGGPDRRQRLGYRFSRFRQYASQRSASRRSRQPSDMSASA
jgi:hypothetical protein